MLGEDKKAGFLGSREEEEEYKRERKGFGGEEVKRQYMQNVGRRDVRPEGILHHRQKSSNIE